MTRREARILQKMWLESINVLKKHYLRDRKHGFPKF